MRVLPPVFPFRGFRGVDAWGAGGYGAPRDGGTRQHKGLDFLSVPGDACVAPFGGVVIHTGFAYAGSGDLHTLHILGDGEFDHYRTVLLYLRPSVAVGAAVTPGDTVGLAEDVSAYWAARQPTHPGTMRCHVHMGLQVNGTYIDPGSYLPPNLPVV